MRGGVHKPRVSRRRTRVDVAAPQRHVPKAPAHRGGRQERKGTNYEVKLINLSRKRKSAGGVL